MLRIRFGVLALLFLMSFSQASWASIEIFAKGSVSKRTLPKGNWETGSTASVGVSFPLFSTFKIEGRYSNIRSETNQIELEDVTLNEYKTQTSLFSLGIDVDILSEKSPFQPFIFVGTGYIISERNYYASRVGGSQKVYTAEPKSTGIVGNLGVGFRLRIARSIAFEIEGFAYAREISKPNPPIDLYGQVGIRVFL